MRARPQINFGDKHAWFLQAVAIIILGFLLYANCVNGAFIWDDHGLIQGNSYLKSWSNLPKVFATGFGGDGQAGSSFYRPLQTTVQMAGYSLWGFRPAGYHLISIFTHILAALLLCLFLRNIFQDKIIPFLASLFFLCSPANTEAVCYISGLSDPLVLVFILACFVFYLRSLQGEGSYSLALLSFILALFSKENAVVLPFLLWFYHYAFARKISFRRLLPFFAILGGYILFRLLVLPGPGGLISPAILLERLPVFFAGISEYPRLLLFPFDLHIEYARQISGFSDIKVVAGLILAAGLLILAWRNRSANRGIFFALGWFFITFLPVSNVYPVSHSFIMEHYLYLPSLGFFIVLAILLRRPSKNRFLVFSLRFFATGLLVIYCCLCWRQAGYWKQPLVFYQRTLHYAPQSWRFYNELALEYAGAGDNLNAEAAYKEALRINPDAIGIDYNLLNLYRQANDREKIQAAEQELIQRQEKTLKDYYGQAGRLNAAGNYAQAYGILKKAFELAPDNLSVSSGLAEACILAGRYAEAVELLNKLLEKNPDFPLGYNNLAVAYYYLKQYPLAVKNYDRAVALKYPVAPGFTDLLKTHRK